MYRARESPKIKEKSMVFVVLYTDSIEEYREEFDDPQDANEFAMSTGLDFPDIIIVEEEN